MTPTHQKRLLVSIGLIIALVSAAIGIFVATRRSGPEPNRIPQIWTSSGATIAETDSLAVVDMLDGRTLLFATCKSGHRVDIFDAATGKFTKSFGEFGNAPGRFNRPNGIVSVRFPGVVGQPGIASGQAILVIERDGARVQAFWADSLAPAGVFGVGQLVKPYGGAIHYSRDGVFLFVTDAKAPEHECVLVYKLELKADQIAATYVRRLGDRSGTGVVELPESIVVDEKLNRLLICDEENNDVKVYTLDGRFTGTIFAEGLIDGDPEGIVILEGFGRDGVVVLTGQEDDISNWFIFDRRDYKLLGAFTGRTTIANTDGICIHPKPFGTFTGGAFFAVNDDADIHAFDLAEIAKLLFMADNPEGDPTSNLSD